MGEAKKQEASSAASPLRDRLTGEFDAIWSRLRRHAVDWHSVLDRKLEVILESRLTASMGGTSGRAFRTSALLHAMIVIFAAAVWPFAFRGHANATLSVVPVDLVTIADETNMSPTVREKSALPQSDMQRPPPAQSQTDAGLAIETPRLLQPTLLANAPLQATAPESESDSTPPSVQQPAGGPSDAALGRTNVRGVGDKSAMTMSIPDALRNQIAHCWESPGAFHSGSAVAVSFDLFLNRDGSISQPPVPDSSIGPEDAAFAESVRRAIYACAPYHLPAGRFDDWHAVKLVFDIGELSGSRPNSLSLGR